jgi:DNA-binding NarL/FixJ family response regulator
LVYAKTAVELAKKIDPDLIVMDITLEGELSGIDAIKQIREFSDVPVLYITGNTDDKHVEQAKTTNYLGYLPKPVEFEDLKRNLQKHFDI